MVACYLHLFIIFPQSTYARCCARTYTRLHTDTVCSSRDTRHSCAHSRIAFLSSSYLKLQIRFVYFVTQQFAWRRKKNGISDIVIVPHPHAQYRWGCNRMRKKEKKMKSARIVFFFQFVSSTIKIVGFMCARTHARASKAKRKNALLLRK